MQNKKGMTLIEVMVAMLVLSIAMVGGISFFTSAYRINYSYMESANRIDHALRYVERLKIQRRNYPTYGVFSNIGGNGFTLYFVDSEDDYTYSPDLYFYEDYKSGTIQAPVPRNTALNIPSFTVPTFGYSNYYYYQTHDPLPVDYAQTLLSGYSNGSYVDFGTGTTYYTRTDGVSTSASNNIKLFVKYMYDGAIEQKDAYREFTFEGLVNNIKLYRHTLNINYLSYQYCYPPSGSPFYLRYSYDQGASNAYGYYTNPTPIALYPNYHEVMLTGSSAEKEFNDNESTSETGDESYVFFQRRFYNAIPNSLNHESVENKALRDAVNTLPYNYVTKPRDGTTIPPELGENYAAMVSKGVVSGNEKITKLFYWVTGTGSAANYYNTSSYLAYFSTINVNQQRDTRYIRNVYISMYSIESRAKANEILNNALSRNGLQAKIEYLESEASAGGYKTIKIPFIRLFAHSDDSTLCEDLD